jgi:hypothetical protein
MVLRVVVLAREQCGGLRPPALGAGEIQFEWGKGGQRRGV